jgi:hypothetical protein
MMRRAVMRQDTTSLRLSDSTDVTQEQWGSDTDDEGGVYDPDAEEEEEEEEQIEIEEDPEEEGDWEESDDDVGCNSWLI